MSDWGSDRGTWWPLEGGGGGSKPRGRQMSTRENFGLVQGNQGLTQGRLICKESLEAHHSAGLIKSQLPERSSSARSSLRQAGGGFAYRQGSKDEIEPRAQPLLLLLVLLVLPQNAESSCAASPKNSARALLDGLRASFVDADEEDVVEQSRIAGDVAVA